MIDCTRLVVACAVPCLARSAEPSPGEAFGRTTDITRGAISIVFRTESSGAPQRYVASGCGLFLAGTFDEGAVRFWSSVPHITLCYPDTVWAENLARGKVKAFGLAPPCGTFSSGLLPSGGRSGNAWRSTTRCLPPETAGPSV